MNELERIKGKIQHRINMLAEEAHQFGSAKISVCDGHNWDKDYYNYRQLIIDTLRLKGLNVDSKTSYGVIDITITPKIVLSVKPDNSTN